MNARRWTVAPSGDRFQRDGIDTFLLADTVWAAFSSPTDEEWDAYLDRRIGQGFDAVFVSMLPIPHDRSPMDVIPFVEVDGRWDVGRLNPDYFDGVRRRIARSVDQGLEVIPVLLWNAYLPGTWGERVSPGWAMSDEQRTRYLGIALEAVLPYAQIILISGDDNLDSEAAIAGYVAAARIVREAAPATLLGLHTGPTARYSSELADEDWDFYGYQSGHIADWSAMPRELSAHHLGHHVRRPVLNLEPPYEDHARIDGEGRHGSADVRGASWTSVLAGSGSGLGYAAHGVWSWHRAGDPFTGEAFSGMPVPLEQGLRFRGADDVAFLKKLVQRHDLYSLRSRPDLLIDGPERTIIGASDDGSIVAVYTPEPGSVSLSPDLSAFASVCYDLDDRIEASGDMPASARRQFSRAVRVPIYVFTARA